MDEIVKICKRHEEFKKVTKGYVRHKCNACRREFYRKNKEKLKGYSKKYYEKNKEKVKDRQRKYKFKNRERYRECQKKWILKNSDKVKELKKRYKKKSCDLLTDVYIKSLICSKSGGKFDDVPEEIIHLKREIVRIKRMYRKSKPNQSA